MSLPPPARYWSHVTEERARELLVGFEELQAATLSTRTMSGHEVEAFQFLGRRIDGD